MVTFSGLPFIKQFLQTINEEIAQFGFQKAICNVLKKARAKIVIKGSNREIREFLKKGRGIIIANHPTSASVLALISILESRPDVNLVINHKFYGWVPNADKNLIPVYINHRLKLFKDTFLTRFYNGEETQLNLTKAEEHRKNIESIKRAANKINKGGIVVIFPGFPEKQGSHWYPGVGHILHLVEDKSIKILPIYIDEKRWIDYLRFIPNIGFLLPSIAFSYRELISLNTLPVKDPKKIARYLEKNFYAQLKR